MKNYFIERSKQLREYTCNLKKLALSAQGKTSITDLKEMGDCIAIFGNEARGIDTLLDGEVVQVYIPMKGSAESLNLSAAASIVMFYLAAL